MKILLKKNVQIGNETRKSTKDGFYEGGNKQGNSSHLKVFLKGWGSADQCPDGDEQCCNNPRTQSQHAAGMSRVKYKKESRHS